MNFEISFVINIGIIYIVLKSCVMLKLIFYEVALGKTLIFVLIPRFNISHSSIVSQTLLILILVLFNLGFLCLYTLFLVHLWTI
jgi:hypothetical protein